MVRMTVTREQVRAARIEEQAFRSAGLEPDPLVVKLARARVADGLTDTRERDSDQ
jgi:hypothetical protein